MYGYETWVDGTNVSMTNNHRRTIKLKRIKLRVLKPYKANGTAYKTIV